MRELLRLRACMCGTVPEISRNRESYFIVCVSEDCKGTYATQHHPTPEAAAEEWNHLIENRANQALGNMAKNGRGIRQDSLANLCDKLKTTVLNKNRNYGNSAFRTPLLASNVSPQEALLVRLSDKIARLETLLRGEPDRVQEPLEDTIFDIAGYCILLLAEKGCYGDGETDGK
ncbi:MAG: nucleotide modification associated domain-containing protein [Planctomycetia bacterium]|nr:nucleotide modification associated domain-containing protein [Planctomycetia bacterium]